MFFEEGKNNSTYNQIGFWGYEMHYNPMCFSYVTGLNLQLVTAGCILVFTLQKILYNANQSLARANNYSLMLGLRLLIKIFTKISSE